MRKRIVLSALLAGLIMSGCSSVLMPYSDDFSCRKSTEGGTCGSVTQIYTQSFQQTGQKPKDILQREENTDEEQTALIGVLWRKSQATDDKLSKIEERMASFDMKNQMTAGLVSSLATDTRRIKEDMTKVPLPTIVEAPSIKPEHEQHIQPTRAKKIKAQKKCDIAGATLDPCQTGKCYAIQNAYVTKAESRCSDNVGIVKKCDVVEVIEKKADRVKTENGWITAKYLRHFKGDANASK